MASKQIVLHHVANHLDVLFALPGFQWEIAQQSLLVGLQLVLDLRHPLLSEVEWNVERNGVK